ncbi:MAG TPA: hypothetical protein VER36_12265 [Flavisolibacter sp.]|nr:hypothetical protein [Flavisolibacter sp.]
MHKACDADKEDSDFTLSEAQWKEVQAVRDSIANGAKTYTREEARDMILNKGKRMAYKLEISLEAIYDAQEAADYYEGKRSGLEIIFENTLQQFFDSL